MGTTKKAIINKIARCLFIFISISIIIRFILYILNYRYITWLSLFLVILFIITITLIVIDFIIFKTKLSKSPKIVAVTLIVFVFIKIAQYPVEYFNSIKEYVVTIDNVKYIAIVKSDKYTDVYYYKYHEPFLVGLNEEIHGNFGKGSFNPYESNKTYKVKLSYYDKKGNQTKEEVRTINNGTTLEQIEDIPKKSEKDSNVDGISESIVFPEDMKILYEKQFGDTILRFVHADYVLGQNQLVLVIKSADAGKSFKTMTKSPIQVSNEAEFTFVNENIGYAISTGYLDVRNNCSGFYVTTDGGKTLENAEFKYDKEDTYYIAIEGFPYKENGVLKLECSVHNDNDTIFISKDNGLTWELEK